MKLIVLCFVLVSVYTKCDGNRFDEFLQEKEELMKKVDELFESVVSESQDDDWLTEWNDDWEVSLQPLQAPEWPDEVDSLLNGDISASGLVDHQNYRPPENIRPEYLEGSADAPEDSDDEGVGSDGSGVEPEARPPGSRMSPQCAARLKADMRGCADLALNAERLVVEMGRLVVHTGYYNVSLDNAYLSRLYRLCMGGVLMPAECLRDAGHAGVVERAYGFIDEHVRTHTHTHEAGYSTCFKTHLTFLGTCLGVVTTRQRLEGLIKAVILRDKGEGAAVCQGLVEVQQCFVTSLAKCEADISLVLVEQMFEVTKRDVTCVVLSDASHDGPISGVDTLNSLGAVVLFVLSILTARLR